jgi:hypothetical protein
VLGQRLKSNSNKLEANSQGQNPRSVDICSLVHWQERTCLLLYAARNTGYKWSILVKKRPGQDRALTVLSHRAAALALATLNCWR